MVRPGRGKLLGCFVLAVTNVHPAIAVIDGKLCRVSRHGTVIAQHHPLATAVLEFVQGELQLFVREHTYGLLPGVPNLYSLDADFRLLWLAEWPLADDPCTRIVEVNGTELVTESAQGTTVVLDASTGRLSRKTARLAAAS